MENHEDLAVVQNAPEAAENVETPTEQVETTPETVSFTKEQFESIVGEKKSRARAQGKAQAEREMKRKYEPYEALVSLLRTATGKEDIGDITKILADYYGKQGANLPAEPQYSERDISALGNADAAEVIGDGLESVVSELDRLAELGVEKMTPREKVAYRALAEYRQREERSKELAALGISEEVYNSKPFQDLAAKFNRKTPIREIYDIFVKMQPQKQVQTMGSVKNTASSDDGIKDFYTPQEARKFTVADYNKNPALYKKVLECMREWKKK
jgi:hypothetical protein